MIDLAPAAQELSRVVAAVRDDQLAGPTPCPAYTVADLIHHVDGLALAFAAAARKQPLSGRPTVDGSQLDPDWRERVPQQLAALVEAWRDPAAWGGMTSVGGIDLPGGVAGIVGLNEVTVHGWDIARATGQQFTAFPAAVEACSGMLAAAPANQRGPFGPVVPVPDDAPPVDRLIGLAGRDPSWQP